MQELLFIIERIIILQMSNTQKISKFFTDLCSFNSLLVSDQQIKQITNTFFCRFFSNITSNKQLKCLHYIISLSIKANSSASLKKKTQEIRCYWQAQLNKIFKDTSHKSQICKRIFAEYQKAYYCRKCMLTNDSILCSECFRNGNHFQHQDFQIVFPSIKKCNCGDEDKWKEETSCAKHSKNKRSTTKCLKQFNYSEFQQQFIDYFSRLMTLFRELKHLNNQFQIGILNSNAFSKEKAYSIINQSIKDIVKIIDDFGSEILNILSEIAVLNENGLKMVCMFLNKQIWSKNKQVEISNESEILNENKLSVLFWLFNLSHAFPQTKTSFLSLIKILLDDQELKKDIICIYFYQCRVIPKFILNYADFNIILNRCKTISLLVSDNIIDPFTITPSDHNRIFSLEETIEYYFLMNQLISSPPNAAFCYLSFHFTNLSVQQLIFHQNLGIQGYQCEFIYLESFIKSISIIQINCKDILKQIIRKFVHYLIDSKAKRAKKQIQFYRSAQRSLSILLFTYFDGQIDELENQELLDMFYNIKSLQNLKDLLSEHFDTLKQISSQEAESFYIQSYEKKNLILSIDSIYLRILLKLAFYLNIKMHPMFENFSEKIITESSENWQINNHQEVEFALLLMEALTSNLPNMLVRNLLENASSQKTTSQKTTSSQKTTQTSQFQDYAILYDSVLLSCQKQIKISQFEKVLHSLLFNERYFEMYVSCRRCVDEGCFYLHQQKCKTNNQFIFCYTRLKKRLMVKNNHQFSVQKFHCPYSQRKMEIYWPFLKNSELIEFLCSTIIDQFTSYKTCEILPTRKYEQLVSELCFILKLSPKQNQLFSLIKETLMNVNLSTLPPHLSKFIKQNFSFIQENIIMVCNSSPIKQPQNQHELRRLKMNSTKKKELMKRNQMNNKLMFLQYNIQNEESISDDDDNKKTIKCLICHSSEETQTNPLAYFCNIRLTDYYGSFSKSEQKEEFIVFSTCSNKHVAHFSCFKFPYPQAINCCPLCKIRFNFLLPVSVNSHIYRNKNAEIALEDILFKIFEIDVIKLKLKRYQRIVMFQELIKSLENQIAFTGILSTKYYLTHMLPVYKQIFSLIQITLKWTGLMRQDLQPKSFIASHSECNLMRNYITKKMDQALFQFQDTSFQFIVILQEQKGSLEREDWRFVIDEIMRMLVEKNQSETLISMKSCKLMEELVYSMRSTFFVRKIPKDLFELTFHYTKLCKECKIYTNEFIICLLCQHFESCSSCTVNTFYRHSQNCHSSKAILLSTCSGEISLLSNTSRRIFDNFYLNYKGETFDKGRKIDRKMYHLNPAQENKLRSIIEEITIEEQIWNQNNTGRRRDLSFN